MAIALRYAARSDLGLGPKSRNEDSAYAGPNLLVLADGMGGHAAGDVASSMIVGELAPLDDEDVGADRAIPLLEERLHAANAKLTAAMRDNPSLAGMGSTTIAVLRTGSKLAMAHIGDSRAFLLRGDTFSQITKDHSFVQQLVDEGRISAQEASTHPQRSVVTRVMTGQPDDQPDTSLREARLGDRFLLCSDGLSDFVGRDVIEEILRSARTPDEAADRCIEIALKASARDNVTVVVADVVDTASSDLPATVPQVVGAAAKRMRTRTRAIPTSPAEKAAALSREATGRRAGSGGDSDGGDSGGGDSDGGDSGGGDGLELAEEPKRSKTSTAVRRGLGGLVVVALLGAGVYAAWTWTQRQYFVAADAGRVSIYRGVSQDLGPIQLWHVEAQTNVMVTDLPSDVQGSIGNTIPARDLPDAQAKVERLRAEAVRCRVLAAIGTPCDTSTPMTASPPEATRGTIPGTNPSAAPATTTPSTPAPGSTSTASTTTPATTPGVTTSVNPGTRPPSRALAIRPSGIPKAVTTAPLAAILP